MAALTRRGTGDGQVSFEEFAKLMVSLASAPPPGAPLHAQGAPPYSGAALHGAPLQQGLGAPPPHLAGMGQPGMGMMQTTIGVGQGMMMPGGPHIGMFAPPPSAVYGTGNPVQVRPWSRPCRRVPLTPVRPPQDMETFQRMNGLDADALRLIHRRFQDIDTVR